MNILPGELLSALERETGAKVSVLRTRSGGGASREGAELELAMPSGDTCRGYLSYHTRRNTDPLRSLHFRREVAVLKALSREWAGSGLPVARYLASDERYLAILCELVEGEPDFSRLPDANQRRRVADDFMSQLAALHAIDIDSLELDGFVRHTAGHGDAILARLASLRREHLQRTPLPDPLYLLALNWLEDHVPAPPARLVLVHGDAGPANFLYRDGRVTAHLDWELVRYGDPMEDIAMLCIRNLFQPFVPLPEAFAAYRRAGGVTVDLDKVRYYRLYNQVGFLTLSTASLTATEVASPPVFGMNLVFHAAHRRVMAASLAELMAIDLRDPHIPDAPETSRMKSFIIALEDLREIIVPQLADQQAAGKAKGLARLIKWWRRADQYGGALEQDEVADIAAVLQQSFDDLTGARHALCTAILHRTLAPAAALQLCHSGVQREAFLLAESMGAFANVGYAALE